MNRREIIERESRGQRSPASAAIAAAPLYIVSASRLDQSGAVPITGLETERYRAIATRRQLLAGDPPAARRRAARDPAASTCSGPPRRAASASTARWSASSSSARSCSASRGSRLVRADAGRLGLRRPVGAGRRHLHAARRPDRGRASPFDVASNLLLPGAAGAGRGDGLRAAAGDARRAADPLLRHARDGARRLDPVHRAARHARFFWSAVGAPDRGPVPRGRPPAWAAGEAMPWPTPGEEPAEPRRPRPPCGPEEFTRRSRAARPRSRRTARPTRRAASSAPRKRKRRELAASPPSPARPRPSS